MSDLLDELARSLVKPMPRSRAIRVLGTALVSAAVPASLRPRAAHASPSGSTACPPKPTCDKDPELPKFCGVENVGNDKCVKYRYKCCQATDTCCEASCCPKCTRCGPMSVFGNIPCDPIPGKQQCRAYDFGSKKSALECCAPSECCFDNGPFGKGQVKVTCCPRERCCGGECCGREQTCVKGKCKCNDPKKKKCGKDCCSRAKGKEQPCCDKQICCREPGGTCCGIDCCNPKTQQNCCKKGEGTRCCPNGLTCCGKECCNPKETTCTRSPRPECCDKDKVYRDTCCPPGTIVTQIGCCPERRAIGTSRCCPDGTVAGGPATNPTCCPPGNPDCCELPCLPPTVCISGTCREL